MTSQDFVPKLVTCMQEGYSKETFFHDFIAGITVGIISLPLAMAFAIGAGCTPESGLYTAIIAGFVISLLGGSRVQIAGPTGAYMIIIYTIMAKHGYEGLALATLIAGGILFVLGATKCGAYVRFIPYPVVTGFTTGIATNIIVTQAKDFFGFVIPSPSIEFLDRLSQYWEFKGSFNPHAFGLALLTVLIIIFFRRLSRKIPGAVIAVLITSFIAYYFQFPINTIEAKFGAIPSSLPMPTFPTISLDGIQAVTSDAITIALLGAIESLLSCVVADGMTGFRHRSNTELMAQGLGNIGSVIFGGIPATGAIARTTANVQLGAKTPIAGLLSATTLIVLMALFAPYAGMIPLPTLAGVLCFVAYNMAEFDHFFELLRGPKSDAAILLTTFALTVFIDLTVAVQAGVLLAAFSFLKHMSEKTTCRVVELAMKEDTARPAMQAPLPKKLPLDTQVFEIEGPFFFAVTDLLHDAMKLRTKKTKRFILRMPHVSLIDTSGMQALNAFHEKCEKVGVQLVITELRPQVREIMKSSSIGSVLPDSMFKTTLEEGLETELQPTR